MVPTAYWVYPINSILEWELVCNRERPERRYDREIKAKVDNIPT